MSFVNTQQAGCIQPLKKIRIGVVGLGTRASWICALMQKESSLVKLECVVDPDRLSIDRHVEESGLAVDRNFAYFQDLEQLLVRGVELDGIVVGTRCDLHTPIATKLMLLGIPLFLEKPVAISWQQLADLRDACRKAASNIVVSFPLRCTPIYERVKQRLDAGDLGCINQIAAFNFVNYGNVYIDEWYRDYQTTGGLWLQKATHDFDYIHHLVNDTPLRISAMHSRKVWEENIKHQDAGSAMIMYSSGLHAAYSQNFVSKFAAGKRGARITGEYASIEFDWNQSLIHRCDHQTNKVETQHISNEDGHGGGDRRLAKHFLDVIAGETKSQVTLQDGLLSAATCLAARDAAYNKTVEVIPSFGDHQTLAASSQIIEPPLS
ncbi:Gfo/Idh/MocA family protein [Poriferisphaera sp. WC338]|uniref:Gfo/Idh/MocA family protein n=1 Tax=Poriferisphaera sp. WC338 TaxID=3425129 RepID=UPI003D814B52